MIDKLVQRARRLRRSVSRTRWTARILNRPEAPPSDEPGLVILQIDGLSRAQFEAALKHRRLPHLAKLIRRGHYETRTFYSGLPSTTPAVQAEVMFGVRTAVPAFQFLDRKTGEVVRMFDAAPVAAVSERLTAAGEPLLAGGASYSNIYAGGAVDARFCAETLDEDRQKLLTQPRKVALFAVLYLWTILRVAALAVLEAIIALGDMLRGVAGRESWLTEFKFIASRVGVSIVLREYLRVMVKLAMEESRPIIYANFLGYDEQAHRRGPDSLFAHWVLKGVDGVIGDVSRAARRSPQRDYEVIVFSDHGQERTQIYSRKHGRDVEAAVREAFAEGPLAGRPVHPIYSAHTRSREQDQRARRLLSMRRGRTEPSRLTPAELGDEVIVTAMGPLGHIYAPRPLDDAAREAYARRLVAEEGIPLALYRDARGTLWAHNARGRWLLPDEAEQVLGPNHPFAREAADDLVALSQHENAGDLMISGWDPTQDPVTFVDENGAHGSVGSQEMRGFALVPDAVDVEWRRSVSGEEYLRGEDLYHAARRYLGREQRESHGVPRRPTPGDAREPLPEQPASAFRVMTYNIHSGIGLDGRVQPERVLRVIRTARADVVALQEVDANRHRSRRADQAQFLADALDMSHHYFAVLEDRGERYGLAVISRFPVRVVQTAHLTPADSRRRSEARGAMWVELTTDAGTVQLINTHFGLTGEERRRQAAALAGEAWLGQMAPDDPVILCGDLNAGPRSPACQTLGQRLRDVQCEAASRRRRTTFPSVLSVRRIDHIFVSEQFRVRDVFTPRSPTAVIASDHLPVCADLELIRSAAVAVPTEREDRAVLARFQKLVRPPANRGELGPGGTLRK